LTENASGHGANKPAGGGGVGGGLRWVVPFVIESTHTEQCPTFECVSCVHFQTFNSILTRVQARAPGSVKSVALSVSPALVTGTGTGTRTVTWCQYFRITWLLLTKLVNDYFRIGTLLHRSKHVRCKCRTRERPVSKGTGFTDRRVVWPSDTVP